MLDDQIARLPLITVSGSRHIESAAFTRVQIVSDTSIPKGDLRSAGVREKRKLEVGNNESACCEPLLKQDNWESMQCVRATKSSVRLEHDTNIG